jgi:hypothetical protein
MRLRHRVRELQTVVAPGALTSAGVKRRVSRSMLWPIDEVQWKLAWMRVSTYDPIVRRAAAERAVARVGSVLDGSNP